MVSPSTQASSATFVRSSRLAAPSASAPRAPRPLDAGELGALCEVLAARVPDAYVLQRHREPHLQAEVHDLLDQQTGTLLEHEHRDDPEGHLLPVPVVVSALQRRKTIVDGVRRRATPGPAPQPRPQLVAPPH